MKKINHLAQISLYFLTVLSMNSREAFVGRGTGREKEERRKRTGKKIQGKEGKRERSEGREGEEGNGDRGRRKAKGK